MRFGDSKILTVDESTSHYRATQISAWVKAAPEANILARDNTPQRDIDTDKISSTRVPRCKSTLTGGEEPGVMESGTVDSMARSFPSEHLL